MRNHFRFIFLEPRVGVTYDKSVEYAHITMYSLVEDIEQVRKALDFSKISVLGHSTCGLIALEYARKYPEHTSHIIINATPPGRNNEVIKARDEYWETHASAERKRILQNNLEKLTEDKLQKVPSSEASIMEYFAYTPMFWYDPSYDWSWLVEGYRENTEGWDHYFTVILSKYDIAKGDKVRPPIFLVLGHYDFRAPSILWDDLKDLFPNLSVHLFDKSGHFPQLEEQALFTKKLLAWITGQ